MSLDGSELLDQKVQMPPPINYCSGCGSAVEQKVPPCETLPRAVCPVCQTIHYQNPKVVTGCIPEWEGKILLCQRAIEPRVGLWTFPAGFMELQESAEEAAARETLEEAHARVTIHALYAVLSLPHVDQVYIVYRGILQNSEFSPGEESLDVQLFSLEEIPWDHLAFPVIKDTLSRYVKDIQRNFPQVHYGIVTSRIDRSASPH